MLFTQFFIYRIHILFKDTKLRPHFVILSIGEGSLLERFFTSFRMTGEVQNDR